MSLDVSLGLSVDLVKAGGHHLRQRILARLDEGVASPSEMAKEFEESLPLVSYHVRILLQLGCVGLVREGRRRGAIEHYYALTPAGERVIATFASATVRQKLCAAQKLVEDAREIQVAGSVREAISDAAVAVTAALMASEGA